MIHEKSYYFETFRVDAPMLERLVQEGTEILHIGICAGRTEEEGCPGMKKMAQAFRDKGVKVVWGAH